MEQVVHIRGIEGPEGLKVMSSALSNRSWVDGKVNSKDKMVVDRGRSDRQNQGGKIMD